MREIGLKQLRDSNVLMQTFVAGDGTGGPKHKVLVALVPHAVNALFCAKKRGSCVFAPMIVCEAALQGGGEAFATTHPPQLIARM